MSEGSTTLSLALPKLYTQREITASGMPLRPVGSTLTVTWSAGVEWPADTTPTGYPRRAIAFLYPAAQPLDIEHGTAMDVTTDGLTSTMQLPPGLAPGSYLLKVSGTPSLPAGACPPAACSTFAAVGRFFDVTVD